MRHEYRQQFKVKSQNNYLIYGINELNKTLKHTVMGFPAPVYSGICEDIVH